MDADALGRAMHQHSFSLSGVRTPLQWEELLRHICHTIRMCPAGAAATWSYPTGGGKGGYGRTIVQPITDSFLALDTWPDHGGAYLVICSCRRFDPHPLHKLFRDHGLKIEGEV